MNASNLLFLGGVFIVWAAFALFIVRDVMACWRFARDYQPPVYTCQTRQEAGWQEETIESQAENLPLAA